MRQKRVFMTLALILGILALSMAYAAISSQTLNVNGNATATTSDSNFDVKFTGDVTSSGDGTVTGYIDTEKDPTERTAVLSISGLKVEGQKATGCINIINNSEGIKAVLTISNMVHTNSTWYKVDAELGETTYWDSSTQKPILLPGEIVPLYVTVELLQTPKNDAEAATAVDELTIKVNADPIDADAQLGDYGAGGIIGGNTSAFTINGYGIKNGGYNGSFDGSYAYAQIDCKEEDLTAYNGTLHIWTSSSSEESATTYDMEVAQNVIPYVVQTSSALTLESETQYTYYITFTNGTNTITTPTKTYTVDNITIRTATICTVNTSECYTCNGTGEATHGLSFTGGLEPYNGETCTNCGGTDPTGYDIECDGGCWNHTDYTVWICDNCYDSYTEAQNQAHISGAGSTCGECLGLLYSQTYQHCETHDLYCVHAYCDYCGYLVEQPTDVSQLQHECN